MNILQITEYLSNVCMLIHLLRVTGGYCRGIYVVFHIIMNCLPLVAQLVWYCCFFLVSRPGRHARIKRRCGLEQVCWSNLVPTLDSGQSIPRLWVPNPYSLSPTWRSNMHANDKGWMNRYIGNDNRERNGTNKGQTRGHQLHIRGLSVTSLVKQRT